MNTLIVRYLLCTAVAAAALCCALPASAQTSSLPPRDKPGARARYEHDRLRNPATGTIPENIRTRETAFASTLPVQPPMAAAKGARLQAGPWTARGPSNIGGRTRAFAIDLADERNMMAGGVSGGMWRSIDGGQSWVRTSRIDRTPSVTCIAQDPRPGKTHVWYYGTGEWYGSASSVLGDGMFRSTDNGLTWEPLASTASGTPHVRNAFDYIWRIAVDPSKVAQDVLYAAVVGGIYRSDDGGETWELVLGEQNTQAAQSTMTDLVITSTGVLYATLSSSTTTGGTPARSGIFRSADGMTWTDITPPSFPNQFGRIVPAVVPSDENLVYFLADASQSPSVNLWRYRYVSGSGTGMGGTWDDRTDNIPMSGIWPGGFNSQGSYNLAMVVHPNDPDVVCIGATNIFVSTDGFTTPENQLWIGGYNPDYNFSLEDWINMMYPNHHSDIHALMFLPSDPSVLISAGDGGIHITSDYLTPPVAWTPLNNGYATTQFYTVAINRHVNGDQTIIGGLQDNHTYGSPQPGAPWEWLGGGDGSYCAIPPDKSAYYISAQGAYLCRSTVDDNFRWQSITYLSTDTLNEGFLFIAPFELDYNNTDALYLASMRSIWRKADINNENQPWVRVATLGGQSFAYISAFQVSQQPADVLYYGTYNGMVYRKDNATSAATPPVNVTGTAFPPAYVSCIAIDPDNADRALVVFSNYEVPSLFYTENGGQTWIDVSGNLEEQPDGTGAGPACNWAEIVPTKNGTLFLVGTSVGLYATDNLNGSLTQWVQEGATSIGSTIVSMIRVRRSDGFVAVATHGNGIFTGMVGPATSVGETTPDMLFLEQNYPNPCADKTTVSYAVPRQQQISLKLHDAFGRVVATPVRGVVNAGYHTLELDTRDLAPGRYYLRMEAGSFAQTRLLTVVR